MIKYYLNCTQMNTQDNVYSDLLMVKHVVMRYLYASFIQNVILL